MAQKAKSSPTIEQLFQEHPRIKLLFKIRIVFLVYPVLFLQPLQYGLPFVSKDNLLVSTINGTGMVIETIYVLIFLIFATRKEKGRILGLLTLALAIFGTVAFVSFFALQGNTRKLFCGLAATIFSIIMYASPLSIIRLVIRTKSVEFMPFFLSLFVFLCGTCWFIYGLLGRDPFLAIPNGFGCGLGAIQLILYFIYRKNKGEEEPVKKPTSQSMEMSSAKPQQEKKIWANGSPDEQV
ncbi:bidirectional sugar transporter SWEET1 isoform X2 [Manihot esculenta]|uniref:bidirectional sugar transporter SWEET1 isoform X2 n=1 Tax=Manihot esculenta TaxID=3983 RepID=UPI000B5D347A|nr:bidirectional sugar transporter SWEET1 isoform X2 [Manihot esculenta]